MLAFAAFADAKTFAANAAVRCLKAARADEADDDEDDIPVVVVDVTDPATCFLGCIDDVVEDEIGGGSTTPDALDVIGTDAFFCCCCEVPAWCVEKTRLFEN